jgi:hypothetical protein
MLLLKFIDEWYLYLDEYDIIKDKYEYESIFFKFIKKSEIQYEFRFYYIRL